jgi:hypothetical protein
MVVVGAIADVEVLHRLECRQQVEAEYSLGALGERVEQWLRKMNLPLYKAQ